MSDDVREIVARAVCWEFWFDSCDASNQVACWHKEADAILAALTDAGYVVVGRDRVERLIAVGEAVEVWLADAKTMLPSQLVRMSPEARRYLQQVIDLEYPFLPGDLDPLPKRGE